jgi:hypothetical protein
MKMLYLLPLLGLLACGPHKPATQAHLAMQDCDNLYQHILELQINRVDFGYTLSPDDRQEALRLLDQEYQQRGTTDRFYRYCSTYLTTEQFKCAETSRSFEEIDNCKIF